jgi:hypothetical protein
LKNATKDTPIHELLHPFVFVLKKENPRLYAGLLGEFKKNTNVYNVWMEDVRANTFYAKQTENIQEEEAFVQYLGELIADMHDDKGNRWREDEYEGYGEFGGKDYYELLSEMNGGPADREHGIDIAFSGREDIKYPNLVESYHWKWVDKKPKDCPRQGFFYDQYENEEDNEQTN